MNETVPDVAAPSAPGELFSGPPAYAARSPWSWWMALIWALVLLAGSTVSSLIITETAARLGYGLPILEVFGWLRDHKTLPDSAQFYRFLTLGILGQQAFIIWASWLLAGYRGADPRRALALDTPVSPRAVVGAILGMVVVLLPFELASLSIDKAAYTRDMFSFAPALKSDALPLLAIAIVIGAPLSEEMMFRGLLLSSLWRSWLRFAGGAAVATIFWASLHMQYSGLGLAEVALIGLYLSWTLWRTGSLWVPMACHAANNGVNLILQLTLSQ